MKNYKINSVEIWKHIKQNSFNRSFKYQSELVHLKKQSFIILFYQIDIYNLNSYIIKKQGIIINFYHIIKKD